MVGPYPMGTCHLSPCHGEREREMITNEVLFHSIQDYNMRICIFELPWPMRERREERGRGIVVTSRKLVVAVAL